jgi:hypothetical protein
LSNIPFKEECKSRLPLKYAAGNAASAHSRDSERLGGLIWAPGL